MSRWPDIETRFLERVNKTATCWIWTGAKIPTRGLEYGVFNKQRVHRFSYELYRGPIPQGKELDHLCRITLCVNPQHLEPVSHKVNVLRGTSPGALNAKKTMASCGHPYTGQDGLRRYCKPCRTKWAREYYHKCSDQILANQKVGRAKNPPKYTEAQMLAKRKYCKEYYVRNREKLSAKAYEAYRKSRGEGVVDR